MSEYIKRERVLEILHEIGGCGALPDTWEDGYDKAINEAYSRIESEPAADVAPQISAEWVYSEYEYCHCSNCGYEQDKLSKVTPFCPNCGARMEDKEEPSLSSKVRFALDDGAYAPEYAHPGADAGADIRTPVSFIVPAHSSAIVDTGVHVEIPCGYVGMIKSKSGLNAKCGILTEGVIDSGYSGSIRVKLYNNGGEAVRFYSGDKITQLVIIPFLAAEFERVKSLAGGERGDNGFGSTGR